MHAAYVRVWFVGGLAAIVLAIPAMIAQSDIAATLLAVGLAFLSLAVALGLLPAFAHRDHPTPLFAIAPVALAALALPFLGQPRAFDAILGASLFIGAIQPLGLLLSPRWASVPSRDAHATTDRAALVAIIGAIAAVATGARFLVGGEPAPAFTAILAAPLLASFGALLFTLPRQAQAPLRSATLALGAVIVALAAAAILAASLAYPAIAQFRAGIAATALALALGIVTIRRAAARAPMGGSILALAILAALAALLATLYGSPNTLLPAAFFAFAAFGIVLLSSALVTAAPLLLPGRAAMARWSRWGPALLIASLFLYTPALQLGRSAAPAAIVAAIALIWIGAGLAPLARSRS